MSDFDEFEPEAPPIAERFVDVGEDEWKEPRASRAGVGRAVHEAAHGVGEGARGLREEVQMTELVAINDDPTLELHDDGKGYAIVVDTVNGERTETGILVASFVRRVGWAFVPGAGQTEVPLPKSGPRTKPTDDPVKRLRAEGPSGGRPMTTSSRTRPIMSDIHDFEPRPPSIAGRFVDVGEDPWVVIIDGEEVIAQDEILGEFEPTEPVIGERFVDDGEDE